MESPHRPGVSDPDFDPEPVAPVRLRAFNLADHQRLVVNPFLTVLALMAWWLTARWLLIRSPFPPLAVSSILPLALLPRTIQYHCLDCGRTGLYIRRHGHSCNAILIRWNERRKLRWPIPSASTQLVIWWYVIGAATLLHVVTNLGPDRP